MSDPRARPLLEDDVDDDPLRQFATWFEEAGRAGLRVPEAMALATASAAGEPSVRMVLLKGFDAAGFAFYSGYESRKGRDLAENPRGALLLHWDVLGRQVRVEGPVERLDEAASDAYFRTRPRGAQLSASATPQGEVVRSRAELERHVAELAASYAAEIPRPAHWGGFRLRPELYEFWQHREDRLHDRIRYVRSGEGWRIERLAP